MLIVVEGLDGAGKTTLVEQLAVALHERGRPVEVLREPGGVELSERVRALIKDPDLVVGGRAEALLFAAARAQLVEERLRPLLDEGADVLLDRFVASSIAYQGAGRGLGASDVAAINAFGTGGLEPDLTLFLQMDPAVRLQRLGHRGEATDRLEAAGDDFFARVARAYDEIMSGERVAVIDATQTHEAVLTDALRALGYEDA